MRRKGRGLLILFLICLLMGSCGSFAKSEERGETAITEEAAEKIIIGFSQVGAESDWRSANTESMKETFSDENGYELLFEDGQQKQANQIRAIRTFIQRGVDYIVLAPVVETGWDTVLQETKDAGIPVIIVDRMVDVEDEDLYAAWVGSDFALEGAKASEWIHQFLLEKEIPNVNIVNIQGTIGATAQIGRSRGLRNACQMYAEMTLLAEVSGEFTQAKGKEVMQSLLEQYGDEIDIAYCENDNEAFGVIEAIEAAGKKVGSNIAGGEIMVVSFDGVNEEAIACVLSDKITCIAECNPMQGPRVEAVIKALEVGNAVDRRSYVEEEIYAHDDTVKSVTVEETEYPVTVVTESDSSSYK